MVSLAGTSANMLSKGGQIEYSCPYCTDTDITHEHIPKSFAALLPETDIRWNNEWCQTSNYGHCNACDMWFGWTYRHKKSLKTGKESCLATITQMHGLKLIQAGPYAIAFPVDKEDQ